MNKPDFTLTVDDRIVLKLETPADADTAYQLVQDNYDYLNKWVYWVTKDYTLELNRKYILENYQNAVKGRCYVMDVYYDTEFVGCVDARINDDNNWEVGYWIAEKAAGTGIATKSVAKLIEYVHEKHDIKQFELFAAVDNAASNRVAEKLGFIKVGEVENQLREAHYVKSL